MANQNESVFASLTDLTGITAEAAKSLSTTLKINTVADLAESPHFAFAAELTDAASRPGHPLHRFGIPLGRVVQAFETKPVEELYKAPLSALEGIGKQGVRELVKALGVKTLRELALWPPFLNAREVLAKAVKDGIIAVVPKFYRISGLVVRSDGTPVVDAAVKVQRQGVSKTTPLVKRDTVKTNGNGGFIVEYPRPDTPIDLRVELITDRDRKIADTRQKVIGQAGVDERVRFVVGDETFRGLSTFERLERSIERGLAGEGIKPSGITGFDQETLARLSLSTGVLPQTTVLLRQSFERADETGLPAAIFFAMGREKISIASLPALLVQDPEKRRAAVKAALAANHIPNRLEKEATKVLAKLDELTVTEALNNPAAADISSVGTVLEGAHVSAAKGKKLADRYISHTGTVEDFWKEVETSGDLTNAEVGRVQFELQLAVATLNHAPLSQALKTGGVAKLEDLAAFDKQGLLALIKGTAGNPGAGLPADHKAAGTTEEEYADLIFCVVEDALPTAMVAHRVANFPDSQRLKVFLDNNSEFDLRTTPVRTYLERNPGALSFAANDGEREAVTKSMKRIERAYRIAPPGARVETMEILLNDGLDSAHKVRLLGRAAFMQRYEQRLGKVQAQRVFRRANNASALAEIVAARYSAAFDATPFHVLAKQGDSLRALSFADMFGSLDFCSCEHCQSVFGPSAYLVDVLHWLDQRSSTLPNNKSALDLLLDNRRADIAGIELSCANTNTPLPYIDIINEVLELLVVPPQAPVDYQTTGTPTDLRAHPEHLLEKAYAVVAGAEASRPAPDDKDGVYPFNLPFNLWLEEARIYLGQLGVPRYELMEALQGVDAARADRGVTIDLLGMSPLEWDVITEQATPSRSVAGLWGLGSDPNFEATLTNVSVLLNQATPPIADHGMEFSELIDDLRADFVQMPSALKVAFAGSTCDTENATLDGLTEDHLGRLHRFIRLRRRLGWSALDLDRAIQILSAGVLDDGCLMKIAHVCRLTAALDISVAEALTGWGLIDTRRWGARLTESLTGSGFELTFDNQIKPLEKDEDASPYEKLFQNASVEVDPSDAFDINAGGDELRTLGTLSDQITSIASALGVTAEELAELLPGLARRNGQINPTPDQLNLANLSTLYAHVSLARSLRMSMRDFRSVLDLTGIDPFDVANIEASLDLVNQVHFIRDSGFSVDELNYLLRHVDTKPASLAIVDTDIGVLFFELGAALRVTEAQFPAAASLTTADELREQLTQVLAVVLDEDDVNKALAFIDIDPQNNQSPPATAAQFIDDKLATVLDAADAKVKLTMENDPAYKGVRRERLEYVLDPIVIRLRAAGKAAAVIERMASATGLEQSICAPLLREHLTDPGGSNRHLLELFADDAVRDYIKTEDDSDEPILPGPADLPDQFGAYTLLHKAAVILNRLRINKNELDWVLRQGPTHGTLDFQSLPNVGNVASAPYAGWKRLRESVGQRDRFSPRDVFDLFEAAADPQADDTSFEALLVELERRSHWDRADIEFLVGSPARANSLAMLGALGFTYPQDWEDERPLVRLAEVMTVVRRIGLSAQIIWEWRLLPIPANGTPGAQQTAIDDQKAQSTQIKQAVRARYDASQWYEIAANLRDRMRERQRDALVGWLVGNDDRFTDANGLFAHLLLDVEMSPCQLTSRVKQANSSTQLFVQRLLMGLEVDGSGQPLVELSRADADEWMWRKNYRVWEANRKVFLYPENWLEPELRDNKTPFFVELENELLQNEVTAETAETAVRGYLEKLDEVARLEIVGLCEEKDDGANILHVFGRTRSAPPTYYHRQLVDRSRWTPWEKVEAGIEGDHLIPVVFNRRLYIFWAIITEAALEEEQTTPSLGELPDSAGTPNRYYEIRLAWSQRQSQGWAGKKIAAEFIGEDVSDIDGITLDILRDVGSSTADFFFRPAVGTDLVIEPFRYRRSDMRSVYRAKKPGGGPGGIGNGGCGGLDQPPVDPGDDDPTEPDPVASGYFLLYRFRMSGCDGTVTLEQRDNESVTAIKSPPNTETVNQTFTRLTSGGGLAFPATNVMTPGSTHETALTSAKPKFEIVPMRMDDFRSARPFFYQDQRRTFFIVPYSRNLPWIREVPEWAVNAKMKLEPMMHIAGLCERPAMPGNDPWVYDPNATVSLPPAVVVGEPVRRFAASRSLAGRAGSAFAESLGPQVAFVSNMPAKARSTRTSLSLGAMVVDANGDWIGDVCLGASYSLNLARTTMNATYVMPELKAVDVPMAPQIKSIYGTTYRFDVFYHPYLCTMMREINRYGIDGLFDPSPAGSDSQLLRQQKRDDTFFSGYGPTDAVRGPRPIDDFDFSSGGAYALYNWEIFFHVPFRIACQLSQNQRFAEAQKWFHYIFDPTETEGEAPQRFWKVKPLYELFNDETAETGPIAELLLLLQYEGSEPEKLRMRDELIEEVAAWRAHPFSPHALARLRLSVYARSVVMKYIDNLIEWGDQLFRHDTMESVNEATQLYVLASRLLGRQPRKVEREPRDPQTFANLRQAGLDNFGNALVEEIEGMLPEITETDADVYEDEVSLTSGTLFFCIPPNEKLLTEYWGRVADRLFKIRHCMNIEGAVRQLRLFEPPIDPSLLVRARAAGMDLASALSDLNAPLPCYRYQLLSQKATELCADVRVLGQALLSALEKKDAETLALVRAGHQVKLEDALIDVRERQVDETKEALAALRKSKENAEIRRDYYRSRPYMNAPEIALFSLSTTAGLLDATAQGVQAIGSILGSYPNAESGGAGFGGSPVVTVSFGGAQFSFSTEAASATLRINAGIADRLGQLAGLIGSYERRSDDWGLQGDTAEKEIEALERQIVAAEIRVAIADRELANLKLQLDQSKESEVFLRGKYTNVQLYHWMVGQLSSLHFQSYQLAFDLAKRAERAWQFELAIQDKTFIQFGYWDSLKKGLLAGERLNHDLKRMEVAYMESNKREYELVRHVSLRELDSTALLRLRREGECFVDIPEAWFDIATPGHYMRRIKTVSLSIPSVTGPYTAVPCTLTLETNSIRTSPDSGPDYARDKNNPDQRFRDDVVGLQSIVTSQAQEDSGLFETSLRDERYLPFEGAGVISRWKLELPREFRQFDYDTISDVILHIRYTARDGGSELRTKAENALRETLRENLLASQGEAGLLYIMSARQDFPDEWAQFLAPPDTQTDQSLTLAIDEPLFPFPLQGSTIKIAGFELFFAIDNIDGYISGGASPVTLEVSPAGVTADNISLVSGDSKEFGGLPHGGKSFGNSTVDLGSWTITFKEVDNANAAPSIVTTINGHRRLNASDVRDIAIVLRYKV